MAEIGLWLRAMYEIGYSYGWRQGEPGSQERQGEPGSQETSWHVRPQIQGNAFAIVAQQMQ
jgi:hypothetical protein